MCLPVYWTRGIGYELNTGMTSTFNGHWKFTSNKGFEKVTEDLPTNKFMTVTAGKKHYSDIRFCAEALSKDGKGYRRVVKVCGGGPGK
ncbi:hypothetical protein [Allokutzneria albata]|uniref:Uncharacterized protein n=1 Tax=Allokutzneria albata TaxID=211114 RepID=A0A1G9Z7W9_ALLAB|nr:hypothetical protein [Allokutzneria albata]SDN17449.1 hypothetical protein SAMN04489726_5329 [Allokutzneria albata]